MTIIFMNTINYECLGPERRILCNDPLEREHIIAAANSIL
jgi:hypothetical protein